MDKKCHSAKLGALGSKFIESVPHNCDREWKFAYCWKNELFMDFNMLLSQYAMYK
jgi:hypothetical protein